CGGCGRRGGDGGVEGVVAGGKLDDDEDGVLRAGFVGARGGEGGAGQEARRAQVEGHQSGAGQRRLEEIATMGHVRLLRMNRHRRVGRVFETARGKGGSRWHSKTRPTLRKAVTTVNPVDAPATAARGDTAPARGARRRLPESSIPAGSACAPFSGSPPGARATRPARRFAGTASGGSRGPRRRSCGRT